MTVHLLVTTTPPDRASAAKIAISALAAHLAATAQVTGPVASFSWHLGEQGEGEEWNVTFKTTDARYTELEARTSSSSTSGQARSDRGRARPWLGGLSAVG
ncbi:divalent cation tolerance protein CutA [Amycolatopsis sp. NPDC003731]